MPLSINRVYRLCGVCDDRIPPHGLCLRVDTPEPRTLISWGGHTVRYECIACACKALGLQPPAASQSGAAR